MDISSLPISENGSQNNTILRFDKFEEDRLPNALSSLNDLNSSDMNNSGDYDPSKGLKTPENVRKIINNHKGDNSLKLNLITKEIYKVAQSMADDAKVVNKNQADYISK
jgi:hypothetical protein